MSEDDIKTSELVTPTTDIIDKVPNNPETTIISGSEVARDKQNNLDVRNNWTLISGSEEEGMREWMTPTGRYKEIKTVHGWSLSKIMDKASE